jgi:rhamnulokinase
LSETAYAAVDLGAESGRVMLGRINGGRVSLQPISRSPNVPIRLPNGLHWNLLGLFAQIRQGLEHAATIARLHGVGVDAWGVDYALLDSDQRLLGLPFHYRDPRTEGMAALAHERMRREEIYAVTGIQTMPINTVFQLLAEERAPALACADRIALVADLFAFWLTGTLANETTAASSTGLLDARSGEWAREVVDRLRLPARPFSHDLVEPGTTLGPILADGAASSDALAGTPVHAVAGHDTASAFVAAPLRSRRSAVLSSGTWSLLGLELDEPVLTSEACEHNLSNERGIDGTTRLLANVMGLWLVQECKHHWERTGAGYEYAELRRLAAEAPADAPLFDPDDERFLAPGDMPARIAETCRASGQTAPATPGQTIRAALASLACKYRLVLERLERVTGQDVDVVHVVGGGARNDLLCRLTADAVGRPLLAGPVEATALGNVLVQARAAGELGSLAELRAVAAATADIRVFQPGPERALAEDTYGRFLEVTGLKVDPQEPAVARARSA